MQVYVRFQRVVLMALLSLAAPAVAQEREPIRFQPGVTSASVEGSVTGYALNEYVLSGKGGQTVEIIVFSGSLTWLVVRMFPEDEPEGADVFNNFIGGEDAWRGPLPADGSYVVRVGIRRAEARRGGTVDYVLQVTFLDDGPDPGQPLSAPPEEWVEKGACPFECCRYRTWMARRSLTLLEAPRPDAGAIAQIPEGTRFEAVTGETHTRAGTFQFTKASEDFKPGDRIFVYNYGGEGNYRIWFDGVLLSAFLGTSPYGGDRWSPFGKWEREPVQTWWVEATLTDGKKGWIEIPDPSSVGGADDCGQ